MEEEEIIWKQCPEPYHMYECTENGIIRNIKTLNIMKQRLSPAGYNIVSIYALRDDIRKNTNRGVHQMVIYAFKGINDTLSVDHIDQNKSNNNINNLRYATVSEQILNRTVKKRATGKSQLKVIQLDMNQNVICEYANTYEASLALKTKKCYISAVCSGKRISTGGFIFKYKDVQDFPDETWIDFVYNDWDLKISNLARIKHNDRLVHQTMGRDYFYAKINSKSESVHRLMIYAFNIPNDNPLIKNIINHKDGNKTNNIPSNLEWVTTSENIFHYYQTLGSHRLVPVLQLNIDKQVVNKFKSASDAAKFINVNTKQIYSCIRQKCLRSGYYWIREKDYESFTSILTDENREELSQKKATQIKSGGYKTVPLLLLDSDKNIIDRYESCECAAILFDMKTSTMCYHVRFQRKICNQYVIRERDYDAFVNI